MYFTAEHRVAVRSTDSKARVPGSEPRRCHLLDVWPWVHPHLLFHTVEVMITGFPSEAVVKVERVNMYTASRTISCLQSALYKL